MPNLFNYNLLKPYIKNYKINDYNEKIQIIDGWKRNLQSIKGSGERALQSAFLQGVFGMVLDYTTIEAALEDEWNLNIETSTEIDATTPDAILGFYSPVSNETQAVIELKAPKVSLDKKQMRAGKNYGTPIEQAFSYISKYDRCKWVIVSNMIEIRLYKVGRSQDYYEAFYIDELDNEEEFKKFHLLISRNNLLGKDGGSIVLNLSEQTIEHQQDISLKFYNLYKSVRIQLFEELKASNPMIDKTVLIGKAQKFLDRIIFICFCEDMGLLRPGLLHEAIEHGKKSFSISDYVIWDEIKGIFHAIDCGSDKHNIPAYDGGLFEYDDVLNNLTISNDFFAAIYDISGYNFATDLDVNILGHIFEQSISDMEILKADLETGRYDAQHSRRKKDGIYYTPGYITKYIVENSLGKYLEDIRRELGEDKLPDPENVPEAGQKQDSHVTVAKNRGKYLKQIKSFYHQYEERLKQVKVLDPACGSGAFLNQAFDYLLAEYRWIHDQLSKLHEGQLTIFNSEFYQKSVLQNNLYGVDINKESVEITKLSLWLKIADSRQKLPSLDDNIKCGNSLIDDPEIADEKSFNWSKEFSFISDIGGFDVVIGNPPYVRITKDKNYYRNNYESYAAGDLYALFIERGIGLLKDNGYFSYIVPSLFLRGMAYESLRSFILKSGQVVEIREYGDGVFHGVQMPTSTIVIKKGGGQTDKAWSDVLPEAGLLKKISTDALQLKDIVDIQRGLEIGRNKLLNSGRYSILTGGDIKRYSYHADKYITEDTYEQYKKDEKYYTGNRILIRETSNRITATFLNEALLHTRTLYSIIIPTEIVLENFYKPTCNKPEFSWEAENQVHYENKQHPSESGRPAFGNRCEIPYLYLLCIINSSLMQAYYRLKFTAETNIFPKIRIEQVRELPVKIMPEHKQEVIAMKAKVILNTYASLEEKNNMIFFDVVRKYAAEDDIKLKQIVKDSPYLNMIYRGSEQIVKRLGVVINDNVLTLYHSKSNGNRNELLKFVVKEKYQREYLKLFFDNLNDRQYADMNQQKGNILDKTLKIVIPDYNSTEVIIKIVNEWSKHQTTIKELEQIIEYTDNAIDKMVFQLYQLTDDEIKIINEVNR